MHGLTITYEWHDQDVLSVLVHVANGAFSGVAQVYVSLDGPSSWAKTIGRGPQGAGASCEVSLGAFDPECAGGGACLKLVPVDRQGHLACSVTLHDRHVGTDNVETLTAILLTEPALVDQFVAELSQFKMEYDHSAVLRMAT